MQVSAHVITIGDEILYGQILDTNSQWLSRHLTDLGIRITEKVSIGDDTEQIVAQLKASAIKADLVLVTGGLGPTKDDVTKKAFCQLFECDLVENEVARRMLEAHMARRGRQLNTLNATQALLPAAAEMVLNERGTAPGMRFKLGKAMLVSMPGVPAEMKYMFTQHVVPLVRAGFTLPHIVHRFVQTIEEWETALPTYIKLAYLPSFGKVTLRLTGQGEGNNELIKELEIEQVKAADLLGTKVYALEDILPEEFVVREFTRRGLTFSAAESCTGGEFAQRITKLPGSSKAFYGSAVVYAVESKYTLGVPEEVVHTNGVVSTQTAESMADAARAFYQTDYAVSVTGVAGPAITADERPVGTVCIGIAGPGGTTAKEMTLLQDRNLNIQLAATYMINFLRLALPAE